MLPVSIIVPIVGVSLFASSFFLMSERVPIFQASFERASAVDVPKAELPDFAEFPEVRSSILSELKARNTEMKKCSERKRCIFLLAYVETLQNRFKTLSEGDDPLGYLKRKYGKDAYDFIKENKGLIEFKFDERFTAGLFRKTGGKMLSVDNGFSREEVRKTYEEYAINEALPELIEGIRKANSPKMKAIYEFGIGYLLSDMRFLVSRNQ